MCLNHVGFQKRNFIRIANHFEGLLGWDPFQAVDLVIGRKDAFFENAHIPKTIEYGNHEVKGKEILSYLENNDKVIVTTAATLGRKPGTIRIFRADDYRTNRWSPTIEVPQIGFPHIGAWARAIGTTTDLLVIAVEMDSNEDPSRMDTAVQKRLLTMIWLELFKSS